MLYWHNTMTHKKRSSILIHVTDTDKFQNTRVKEADTKSICCMIPLIRCPRTGKISIIAEVTSQER